MIMGFEDIGGGSTIIAILSWLGLTALFYLVCYVAVLNVVDDLTKNSVWKVPALMGAAAVTAGFMNLFHYRPLVLFAIMVVANYYRVQNLGTSGSKRLEGVKINRPLFYIASYTYIFLVLILPYYFQSR